MKKILPIIFGLLGLHFAVSQTAQLEIKVVLEGPFSTGQMTTDLNSAGFLPLTQPYGSPPWNYGGVEAVSAIPNADIVDWVLIDLVSVTFIDDTAKLHVLDRKPCFLLKNGLVKELDGLSLPTFQHDGQTPFHVRIHHRNHLNIISSTALTEDMGLYSWDFTTGSEKALGGVHTQKELIPGHWGMISSDGNASGQVNNVDKNEVWLPDLGLSGYHYGDFNMNGQVDMNDKLTHWMLNAGRGSHPVRDSIVVPTFTCGDNITDIDGNVYNTVLIGDQCWMKENLNVGTMINGNQNQTNNGIIEKYCYNNNAANCDIYGGLYQWNEMMGYTTTPGAQGICPPGWHIPTDDEWKILEGTVDSQYGVGNPYWNNTGWRGFDAGKNLKSTTGWISGGNGTDLYGFGALPGGGRNVTGSFSTLGYDGYWWSSSEHSGTGAWRRYLDYNNNGSYRYSYHETDGFSVRCLRDNQIPPVSDFSAAPISGTSPLTVNFTDESLHTPITWEWDFGDGGTSTQQNPSYTYNTPGNYTVQLTVTNSYGSDTEIKTNYITVTSGGGTGEPCPGMPTVTDIDGNVYNTVLIGTQCWMKENLKTTTYKNGTAIPNVTNGTTWENLTTGAYVWYANDISWKDKYGALYNWHAVVDSNGLCPTGWHVPSHTEWTQLTDSIGGTAFPNGNKLKSCRQVNSTLGGDCNTTVHPRWNQHNTHYGTDDYGFSGLPGGYRLSNGPFGNFGNYSSWWSSTEYSSTNAWSRYLNYANGGVFVDDISKRTGFSVRCLRD